ncbi:MAG: hypothetical protein HY917_04015 [Candidatus Diapherotrites archaeon]|nr:hypothetical protein [Candidatus Diapherotrites archaeon]
MESVSIKLESSLLREMEKSMQAFHYSTKTEFIRDAVRAKLKALSEEKAKKEAWDSLFALKGSLKGQGKAKTDEEYRKIREQAGDEFFAMLEKRFAQK